MNKTDIEILLGLKEILENHDKYTGADFKVYNALERVLNEEKWVTIKGNHILLKDGDTPHIAVKRIEIRAAFEKIKDDKANEIIIKDVRSDLKKYGENNDIAILKGNLDGGALHILDKHSKDLEGIIDTVLKGKVIKHVPNRKIFLEFEKYLVLLSLDYFGSKKTWLLTGYEKEEN